MKPLCLLPLFAVLPLAAADTPAPPALEQAAHSDEYAAGMAAIARLREALPQDGRLEALLKPLEGLCV